MTPKKLFTLVLISVSGIGLFTLFFNLFNQQLTQVASNQNPNSNSLDTNSNSSSLNTASNSTGLISEANTKTTSTNNTTNTKVATTTEPSTTANNSNSTTTSNTTSTSKGDQGIAPTTGNGTIPNTTNTQTTTPKNTTTTPTPTPAPVVTTPSTTYKDGTYSATGSYRVPRNSESIKVSIQVSNDKITSVSVQNSASRGDSAYYQQAFSDAISGEIVGKKIDSVDLYGVNGASLTTEGFMSALGQIKGQAKS